MICVMAGEFSKRLTRARLDAGFKTAYRFYHGNGGRRHFGFTYIHYLRVERRGALPSPDRVSALLSALRLEPGAEARRALCLAYLRDLLGAEPFELIAAPLLRAPSGPPAAGAEALRWMKAEHAVHLTPAQFKLLARDETAYWCSELLCNDSGSWSPAEATARLDVSEKAAAAALSRLAAAGIARKTAAGRFLARKPGKLYTFPGRLEGMGSALKAVQRHWERMYRRRGTPAFARVELVRAEAAAMNRYAAGLAEAVDAANLGATHAAGEETGLYLVEASVRRLMPF